MSEAYADGFAAGVSASIESIASMQLLLMGRSDEAFESGELRAYADNLSQFVLLEGVTVGLRSLEVTCPLDDEAST